jgi:hypothetical protein
MRKGDKGGTSGSVLRTSSLDSSVFAEEEAGGVIPFSLSEKPSAIVLSVRKIIRILQKAYRFNS